MLVEAIKKEFEFQFSPEVSLRQFFLTDQKGMSGKITEKEWESAGKNRVDTHWGQIPESEIKECGCVLAHMGAEEFGYYLPAYMTFVCKNLSRDLLQNEIAGMVVHSLYPSRSNSDLFKYKMNQLSLLTPGQRNIIIKFLEFVALEADDFNKQDAKIALDRFWYKYSTLNNRL